MEVITDLESFLEVVKYKVSKKKEVLKDMIVKFKSIETKCSEYMSRFKEINEKFNK